MSSVDLYDVLDVDHDCSRKDVIQAYRRLVKIYHPDKPTGDPDLFELVNHAFDVLSDPEKREKYNELKSLSDKSSIKHYSRKDEFDKYMQLREDSDLTKTESEAKLDFRTHQSLMDSKREFDRERYEEEKLAENKLTEEQLRDMEKDLELTRDQEEIEAMPDKLFGENTKFDPNLFNLVWEKAHKNKLEIEVAGNPKAKNFKVDGFGVNDSYDDLFSGDTGEFSAASFKSALNNITKHDIEQVDNTKPSGYASHTKGRDDKKYKQSLEDLIKARERETDELEKMSLKDFDTNDKEFQFLYEIGYNSAKELPFNDGEDLKDRYKRLLNERKQQEEDIDNLNKDNSKNKDNLNKDNSKKK